MAKCKTCNKQCEKEYCFQHKPRTGLKKPSLVTKMKPLQEQYNKALEMQNFFLEIWNSRPHKSELSGVSLGKIPSSAFFHHILPKSKYPDYAFHKANIIMLTIDEHDNVEIDMYRYPLINDIREKILSEI